MNTKCDAIKPLFEQFLNGDLRRKERSKVKKHLQRCSNCRIELEKEQQIEAMLVTLPKFKCPEKVAQAIFKTTVTNKEWKFFPTFFGWKTAVVGVVTLAIILFFVFYFNINLKNQIHIEYSQNEILKTRKQAKWSLVYAAQIIQKSERQVVDNVLINNLPQTVRDALKKTVPLFKGGKDEK